MYGPAAEAYAGMAHTCSQTFAVAAGHILGPIGLLPHTSAAGDNPAPGPWDVDQGSHSQAGPYGVAGAGHLAEIVEGVGWVRWVGEGLWVLWEQSARIVWRAV